MRAWAIFLGGLIVWTVHFFGLYAVASIFPDTVLARVLALILTLFCLAADAGLLWWALRAVRRHEAGDFNRWLRLLTAMIAALSLLAVFWQGVPALLA